MKTDFENIKIAIVGLGYVGLPLAIEFGKKVKTIGFDIDSNRVLELKSLIDKNNEHGSDEIESSIFLQFAHDVSAIQTANVFIITVPTPIDINKKPDLSYIIAATQLVGVCLKKNDIVIYESTVYPGCTEEICVPILEEKSRLIYNESFFVGYSPERINPGDKSRKLKDIVKIVAGSNSRIADSIEKLYSLIIEAGVFKVSSIKVAEATKLIENCQRDVNISFMNEAAMMLSSMNINISEVLEAAKTKWNFLDFHPGLVGGHCIGVDPYYMIYQAERHGFLPKVISSSREINSLIPSFVAKKIVSLILKQDIQTSGLKILILGFAYKANSSDFRNTQVFEVIRELQSYEIDVEVSDPLVDETKVLKYYKIELVRKPKLEEYSLIIELVRHSIFESYTDSRIIKLEHIIG